MSGNLSGPPRILLVSDDPAESQKIAALLSEIAPNRPFKLAADAKAAMAALEEADFEIIFTDLAEGALAGTQFLHDAWKVRPKSVRFLLAHTIDSDVLVTCVLGSHHFLQKPLGPDGLRAALDRADSINRLVRNERIQSLVSRMRTLPSRPSLYLDVMRELRSPNASANTVGEYVSKDLAISARLIQVVNSAFYGLHQQVTDPAAAVLLLGLETTASLVLSIEAFARFDKVKPLYFSMDRVWRHCQSVAQSAKQIAELLSNDPEVARNAFTAGLLHDIGKLALALNFEEQYHGALKLAEKQKLPPCEVESQVFGATHAEAGAYLLSLWGLPLPIVEAVAGHHCRSKDLDKNFSAATALHLAERLEYEADLARNGVKDIQLDLDYPAELELSGRLDELRRIVRRDDSIPETAPAKAAAEPPSEGTAISTRAQLKAEPAPVPATGEPAPLLEVKPASFRDKRMFYAIGILPLLLAAALTWAFQTQTKSNARLAKADRARAEERKLSDVTGETASKQAAAHPPAEPAATPAQPETPLRLQAILYNGDRSSLVINGRSFRLGDEVEGSRIVSVQRDEVTVERAGVQRKLKLAR